MHGMQEVRSSILLVSTIEYPRIPAGQESFLFLLLLLWLLSAGIFVYVTNIPIDAWPSQENSPPVEGCPKGGGVKAMSLT